MVTINELFSAGAHIGHLTKRWSPAMQDYIYCARDKVHILNLDYTIMRLQEAASFLGSLAASGGRVLFVCTKRDTASIVKSKAISCKMPYVDRYWMGGTLTNYRTIRNSVKKLQDLKVMKMDGFTKKEILSYTRERDKLDKALGGIENMQGLPDALFVIGVKREIIAIKEAKKLSIPVVAIVDTDCDPSLVDVVIPANDDSPRAIEIYLDTVAQAILDAVSLNTNRTLETEKLYSDSKNRGK